jgi:hypothetical protein
MHGHVPQIWEENLISFALPSPRWRMSFTQRARRIDIFLTWDLRSLYTTNESRFFKSQALMERLACVSCLPSKIRAQMAPKDSAVESGTSLNSPVFRPACPSLLFRC